MRPEDAPPPEEAYASRLAARDDALARGEETPDDDLPDGLRQRLSEDVPFLKKLRQALTPEAPWKTLGRFQVRRELGRGGYGLVYLAFDPRLGREVALKVPRSEALLTAQLRQRFFREARAAAALEHPNIVPVHEAGEVGPVCYITYAYCPGPTLAAWLRGHGEPISSREAAALVATLAEAVHHAHTRGVVHRDLKPGNVLLSSMQNEECGIQNEEKTSGHSAFCILHSAIPKITDFGLARLVGETCQTATGDILGTPSYMAPEQADGRGKEAGPAADVYSVGAILYELLTGRPPFQTATVLETLRLVVEEEPVPPRRLNPVAPRDLETICLKCLAKESRRRYGSARELADDLRRHLAGKPITVRPVGTVERLWLWARRRPTAAALAVVSGLAALAFVGGVTGLIYSGQLKDALDRTEQARGAEAQARHNEQRTSYFHRMTLANVAWRDGNVAKVLLMLDECPEEHRGWEWLYLRRLCFPELRTLRAPRRASDIHELSYSPDGRWLAAGIGRGEVRIWDVAEGKERLVLSTDMGLIWGIDFSPDGRQLATAGEDATVRVWDVRSGRQVLTLKDHTRHVVKVIYSPDGALLASAAKDGTARVWDVRNGKLLRTFPMNPANTSASIAFSPDNRLLAGGGSPTGHSAGGDVYVWDVTDGTLKQTLRGLTIGVCSVAFSPDGRLAAGGLDRTVKVWDSKTGQLLMSLGPHKEMVHGVAFSSSGRLLAVACNGGTVKLWDVAAGRETATLRGHAINVNAVAFEPGGVRLASGGQDGSVRLWDLTALPEPTVFRGHVANIRGVAFHPDGTRLATAGKDETVRVWDVVTGEELLTLWGHRGSAWGLAFSPDGRRLVSTDDSGGIRVWDQATGRPVFALSSPDKRVSWVMAFHPDGRVFATGDTTGIHLWDAEQGRRLSSLGGHEGRTLCVAFSPDGRRLASGGYDHTVRLWDLSSRREEHCLRAQEGEVHGVSFNPDGTRLATASGDQTLCVYDTASGELLWRRHGHTSGVNAVAFSPDGRRIATASFDRSVRVWDAATGEEVLCLTGHTGGCIRLAFDPDGTRIVSTSFDGTARLWDARPVRPEDGVEREALAVARRLIPTSRSLAEVRQGITSDPRIGEAVRRQALTFAETIWPARVRQRASRYVEKQFAGSKHAAQVREAARADPALADEDRQAVREVLERWPGR